MGILSGLRLYTAMARTTLQSRAIYRANFGLSLVFNSIMVTAELIVTLLLVHRVHGILGWNTAQVMLLFGMATTSGGTYRTFLSELSYFDKYLVNGEFDAVLTRPVPAWLAVAGRSVDPDQIGLVIEGMAIVAVSGTILGIFRLDAWLVIGELLAAVVSGTLIWMAMVTALAALGFWTTRVDTLQPMVLYGPQTAATFPLSVYPTDIRMLFYSIFPVAFGTYLPAMVILRKGPGAVMVLVSLFAAAAALALALRFWRFAVRHYTSTGT